MEEIADMFSNWNIVKLKDICDIRNEKFNPKQNGNYKYIALENIIQGAGKLNSFGESANSLSIKSKFYKKDILFGKLRPYLKKYLYAEFDGVCSTEIVVLNTKLGNDSLFNYYLIQQDEFIEYLSNKSFGTKMPRTSWEIMGDYKLLCPPLKEQEKIAFIFSTVDELIINTDHLINSYSLLKKGLMHTLLTKGIGHTKFKMTEIGEIPEEWEVKKTGEICKSGRGRVISLKEIENKPGEYPVFSSQSKENGCIGYLNTYDFDGEYVTWTTDGVYAGTTFYRNGRFNCTNVCGTLKSNFKDIDIKYLSLALSRCIDKYVVKLGNSKLMNNIMEIIPVPIPNDFEEQKKIGRIIQVIEDIININISKKKSIEVLKKGLMQQLLTGKIRVKV